MLEQGMAVRKREDEVFPNAAGIDVGASSHWVAVPPHLAEESVREFGAMTDDLNAMADWLLAYGVDTVALESTGVRSTTERHSLFPRSSTRRAISLPCGWPAVAGDVSGLPCSAYITTSG
jgi:hypothetical protein